MHLSRFNLDGAATHESRVEAAGCRLPGLSRCRTTSRLLIEEVAILEADLPACSATSCACSCPRCGAAPSYARLASLICIEVVTRSPTLTSAPSCAITRLCRRACFLRSWKKNREHTREWSERIELLELDIREVKQVAYARWFGSTDWNDLVVLVLRWSGMVCLSISLTHSDPGDLDPYILFGVLLVGWSLQFWGIKLGGIFSLKF